MQFREANTHKQKVQPKKNPHDKLSSMSYYVKYGENQCKKKCTFLLKDISCKV